MTKEEKAILEDKEYIAKKKLCSDDVIDIILMSKTEEHNLFDEMYYAIVNSFCLGYYRATHGKGKNTSV